MGCIVPFDVAGQDRSHKLQIVAEERFAAINQQVVYVKKLAWVDMKVGLESPSEISLTLPFYPYSSNELSHLLWMGDEPTVGFEAFGNFAEPYPVFNGIGQMVNLDRHKGQDLSMNSQ